MGVCLVAYLLRLSFYIVENYVAGYRAARQLIFQCIYLAIPCYAILTSNDQIYYCLQIALIRKFYSHIVVNWGEPERAPHKWCIESKSLHSDGTTYVRT